MIDLWLVRLSNVITLGNISAVATLIGGGIYFYYKILRYLSLQQYEYKKYIEQLNAQHKTDLEKLKIEISNKD